MFKEVDASEEAAILAASARKKKGPDFTIRTVTHWLNNLPTHFGYCSVPSHYENVPDTDFTGEPYDKYPNRLCVTIEPYEVCRWCYIVGADIAAAEQGLKPVPAGKDENATSN